MNRVCCPVPGRRIAATGGITFRSLRIPEELEVLFGKLRIRPVKRRSRHGSDLALRSSRGLLVAASVTVLFQEVPWAVAGAPINGIDSLEGNRLDRAFDG